MRDIIKDAEKSAPEVSEHVADPEISVDPETISKIKDKAGIVFDPEKHAIDNTGRPVITKAGYFRKRSGPKTTIEKKPSRDPEPEIIDDEAAGIIAANLTFTVGQLVFGPDGQPKPAEIEQITQAYAVYFKSKGMVDLPPGWLLATVLISYAAPRIIEPAAQSRIKRALTWAKNGIAKIKGRRDPATLKDD